MNPPKELQEDLENLASGNWEVITDVEELGKQTLLTLAFQKRLMDQMRQALFQEAAWLLREYHAEEIPEPMGEKLRLCAIRLSEAARSPVNAK